MLDRLLAIYRTLEYEEHGRTELLRFRVDGKGCRVELRVRTGGDTEAPQHWAVGCRKRLDFAFFGTERGSGEYLRLHAPPHPLLAPYTEPHAQLSFNGVPADAAATAERLRACHREIAGEYGATVPSPGRGGRLPDFLAVGYGVVAEGPVSWMRRYEQVLRGDGLRTSLLDQRRTEPVPDARALVLGRSFVVGVDFGARLLSGSSPEAAEPSGVSSARVEALMADGSSGTYQMDYARVENDWRLDVSGPVVGSIRVRDTDVFACLVQLREMLEPAGVRLLCAGARRDVYPSGMSREMSGGVRAYRHVVGRHARHGDLVGIFDPAEPDDAATVAEQRRFHAEWAASLRT